MAPSSMTFPIAPGLDEHVEVTRVESNARLAEIMRDAGDRVGSAMTPREKIALAETARFMRGVLNGRIDPYHLGRAMQETAFQVRLGQLLAMEATGIYGSYKVQGWRAGETRETMTTSDFPLLFGDTLDRQMLGQYQEWPLTWPAIARRATVRDFRAVKRFTLDGLDERWYPDYATPELTPPHENDNLNEGSYTYAVDVYQRSFSINWRMMINDDLDAFQNLAPRLARGARRTEEYFATQLYVDANGPHASMYTSGNKNIVNTTNGAASNNPALSILGLQDAMTVLGRMLDPQGEPIMVDTVVLVVPPSLKVVAENILNATQLVVGGNGQVGGGGVAGQQLFVNNWMRNNTVLVVNPYLPVVASSANGSTSWFLFASPGVSRPAIEIGFLRGYETPSLFQKAPNTMRLGGGIDPVMGDFNTMSLVYKGMHVIGGTRMDAKMTVASNGSGS